MRSILILFVLVLTSCTRVEPKMTVISNKEKFVIENFAKSVTAAEFTYKGHSYIWFHNNNGGWGEINPITNESPLHVHHIDGDATNNSEENLQLLCPNCHSLTENFGRLNSNCTRPKA